jgi:hypothetical protein
VHLLASLKGRVEVYRKEWGRFVPVRRGTLLYDDDILRLGAAAQATVVCSDLQKMDVLEPVGQQPCRTESVEIRYRGSAVAPYRGGPSDGFPVLLSPRDTALMSDRPTIRWTAVPGAFSYKVVIEPLGPARWSQEVQETQLAYPAGAPKLVPGKSYRAVVSTSGRSSEEEDRPGRDFTILDPAKRRSVQEKIEKVSHLGLDRVATALLLAHVYATNDLRAEAIETLEALGDAATDPAVLLLLGDIELAVGLERSAATRYLKLLESPPGEEDIAIHVLANERLGSIYKALGNEAEAQRSLDSAKELFKRLSEPK